MPSFMRGTRVPVDVTGLTLNIGAETHRADGDDIVVFLDESGHEAFSDANFRAFAMGAVVTAAGEYEALIHAPWQRMKGEFFGNETTKLHAKDLNRAPIDQLDALRDFFTRARINRIGRGFTHTTAILGEDVIAAFALQLMPQIADALPNMRYEKAFMLFEETQRLRGRYSRVFGDYHFGKDIPRTGIVAILTQKFFVPSALKMPGIEVADFVAYAAGRMTWAQQTGRQADLPEWVKAVWAPPFGRFLKVDIMRQDPA